MDLSIFGLGYVGAVSAACLAKRGHQVLGCEPNLEKLALFRAGKSPIAESGLAELVRASVSSGGLDVTDDAVKATQHGDVLFVCVGTPSDGKGSTDLRQVKRVFTEIGTALRSVPSDRYVSIVLRSTVPSGTTQDVLLPLLESTSGRRVGDSVGLAFQPEFLREGSALADFDHPPYSVWGAIDQQTEGRLGELFAPLGRPMHSIKASEAELLKYSANAFHAAKVGFANEIGRISQSLGVNSHTVMSLLCEDTVLNISPRYLRPGLSFGGSCLPKDLRALERIALREGVSIPMLSGLLQSNTTHLEYTLQRIMEEAPTTIALSGLSFKPKTDDLRESPLVLLAERLLGKGVSVRIYDPGVSEVQLLGTNRTFVQAKLPHLSELLVQSAQEAVEGADLAVVGHPNRSFVNAVAARQAAMPSAEAFPCLDLAGLPTELTKELSSVEGLCW